LPEFVDRVASIIFSEAGLNALEDGDSFSKRFVIAPSRHQIYFFL